METVATTQGYAEEIGADRQDCSISKRECARGREATTNGRTLRLQYRRKHAHTGTPIGGGKP